MKPEKIQELPAEEQFMKAKDTVGWILSNSPQTASELTRKLVRKGYVQEVADAAVAWAHEYGFVDDTAYAELFLKEYVLRIGKSSSWAKTKLRMKGVSDDDVEEAMYRLESDGELTADAEHARAVQAGETVWRRIPASDTSEARKRKFFSRLARMGYSYSACANVWRELSSQDD